MRTTFLVENSGVVFEQGRQKWIVSDMIIQKPGFASQQIVLFGHVHTPEGNSLYLSMSGGHNLAQVLLTLWSVLSVRSLHLSEQRNFWSYHWPLLLFSVIFSATSNQSSAS